MFLLTPRTVRKDAKACVAHAGVADKRVGVESAARKSPMSKKRQVQVRRLIELDEDSGDDDTRRYSTSLDATASPIFTPPSHTSNLMDSAGIKAHKLLEPKEREPRGNSPVSKSAGKKSQEVKSRNNESSGRTADAASQRTLRGGDFPGHPQSSVGAFIMQDMWGRFYVAAIAADR